MLGIVPLLWRLGYGRWFRKIAIVANDEFFNVLKNDLIDSGIFREKNISQISTKIDYKKLIFSIKFCNITYFIKILFLYFVSIIRIYEYLFKHGDFYVFFF